MFYSQLLYYSILVSAVFDLCVKAEDMLQEIALLAPTSGVIFVGHPYHLWYINLTKSTVSSEFWPFCMTKWSFWDEWKEEKNKRKKERKRHQLPVSFLVDIRTIFGTLISPKVPFHQNVDPFVWQNGPSGMNVPKMTSKSTNKDPFQIFPTPGPCFMDGRNSLSKESVK